MPPVFFVDFALILAVAVVGGLVALRLRLPPILGYIVGGVLIGPHTTGHLVLAENAETVAELGVALLMFGVGVEFSLRGLYQVRRVAVTGGLAQILLTAALGFAVGRLLGWDGYAALFLGGIVAISSTMIGLRLLGERGELHSRHGLVMLGILIVQDLATVLLVALLPELRGLTLAGLESLFRSLGQALAALAGASLLAFWLVPAVLRLAAQTRSKEMVILAATGVCVGAAVGTSALGLSPALGAFLAGLILSESEYSHEALAEVVPLRDVFASLFFVSIGMLLDPAFVVRSLEPLLVIVAVIVLGKTAIVMGLVRAFGYHPRAALFAALGLAQIGEFSFVIARTGVEAGALGDDRFSLVISAALLTIVATPFLYDSGHRLARWLPRLPGAEPEVAEAAALRGHAIVCGHGRVGSQVAAALERFGIPFAVVDYDANEVRALRARGIVAIYGDASRPQVLRHLHPETATSAAITLPDASAAAACIRGLRQRNPALSIVARGHTESDLDLLYAAGADEVVQAEFEAGLEVVRHTLLHHPQPLDPLTIDAYLDGVRHARYHQQPGPADELGEDG